MSQLDLSLRVGVSQRHLSCVENGRSGASREMLLALLDALEAPLAERNEVLLAAGFAPAYRQRQLSQPDMAPVREALAHLLAGHEPAPALVLDETWTLVQANHGAAALLGAAPPQGVGINLLRAALEPGPVRGALVDEVSREIWQRAQVSVDEIGQLAPARLLEIVGEAAGKVSPEYRAAHPELPWIEMSGLRNRLAHACFDVDLDVLLDIVAKDLPPLIARLEALAGPGP